MKTSISLGLFILLFSSCDGGSNQSDINQPAASESENAPAIEYSVQVNGVGNNMEEIAFEPSELNIPAGAKVFLNFINNSQGEGMNHNILIVPLGSGEEIASEALQAGAEKDYVPDNSGVIASSKVIKPGESVQIEFSAPPVGSYHYICTFPGHYPKMVGRLNVVEAVQ
jgi:azurin